LRLPRPFTEGLAMTTVIIPMVGISHLTYDPTGLRDGQTVKHFEIEAEDGTIFSGTEDDLELVE